VISRKKAIAIDFQKRKGAKGQRGGKGKVESRIEFR
jgi:hypothetical protein